MGNLILDLFKNRLFSTTALTDEINDRDMVPDQVTSLVPFDEKAIITTSAAVVRKGHNLSLVPFSERGGPGTEYVTDKRDAVQFDSRQIRQEFTITAEELQDVLLFGSMGARLEALQDKVREHMENCLDDERTTFEYHRLGTVMGQIRGHDGVTVLEDMFVKFGVDPWPTVQFNLAARVSGQLRLKCNEVIRNMRMGAQARIDTIHAFCGKDFMDLLYAHPDVQTGYMWANQNIRLRDRAAYVPLDFGGIQFEEYTGYTEDVRFVDDDAAHFFPRVVSGANPGNGIDPVSRLFQIQWAPAPFLTRLNQPGIPHYVRRFIEQSDDPSWVRYEISSYPIFICRKPRATARGQA